MGRKDPSPSAALPTLAGPLASGGGAQAPCGPLRCLLGVELFCLQLLSGPSPDPLTSQAASLGPGRHPGCWRLSSKSEITSQEGPGGPAPVFWPLAV